MFTQSKLYSFTPNKDVNVKLKTSDIIKEMTFELSEHRHEMQKADDEIKENNRQKSEAKDDLANARQRLIRQRGRTQFKNCYISNYENNLEGREGSGFSTIVKNKLTKNRKLKEFEAVVRMYEMELKQKVRLLCTSVD